MAYSNLLFLLLQEQQYFHKGFQFLNPFHLIVSYTQSLPWLDFTLRVLVTSCLEFDPYERRVDLQVDRFDQFVSFTDISLWIPIMEGYTHPTYSWMDSDNVPKHVSALTTEEKLLFDREKKAMASISISLDVKKSQKELLKKQFLVFKDFQNESLDDLATRFYHLLSELASAKVVYEPEEINGRFLEALPSMFDVYSVIIKENDKYKTMSLEDLLGNIQSHDLNLKKKETNMEHIQDPSMYFAKTSGKSGSGDGQDNSNENVSGYSYPSGFFANTSIPSSGSQPSNSQHVSQRVAEDYMAMFSSFVASYENFFGGKIHDPEAIEEDYRQIDPDDLEEMNIQWNMAMLMRQGKDFLKNTGRNSSSSANVSTSSALVAQGDDNYDLGYHLEDLVGAVSQAVMAKIHTDEPSGDVNSKETSEEIDTESANEVHSEDNVSTTSVSEDEILLTKRVPEMTEEIPTAKVFMADMSDPSKDNDKLRIDRIESLKRDINSLTMNIKEQAYRLDMTYAEIENRNEIIAEKNKEMSNKEAEVIRLHRKLESFGNSSLLLGYFNENVDPVKRTTGIGFAPTPFNGML
ncbi:hypothetical protein L1987_15105 [Smallanthus sonchifolius]|uniref:Uncharacterized protein n=1 Tax=Smallanthus sonchifolius TaxID=185202 RepID=A0ACB9J4Q0_9ASTR|nr:hypothetical protein L1987_15105 [Smallanthus sonchifolius]